MMSKFLSLFTIVFLMADITAAGIGNAICRDARVNDMPADIIYEIQLSGVWPDRYYADYNMPAPRSFVINNYWTFEPSKYPLSPPVWVHHMNELTMQDTDYTVVQVTRPAE
jgi:hypothetical protein